MHTSSEIRRQADKRKQEHADRERIRSGVPDGWWPVEAWTDGAQIVIVGRPSLDENIPEDQQHDCDLMGCGSFSHVIARCEVPAAIENPATAEPTCWDVMMSSIEEAGDTDV